MNRKREIIADIDNYFVHENLETNGLYGIPKNEFESKIRPIEEVY